MPPRRRPALLAALNGPQAVLSDGAGGAWIADTNNSAVRRLFVNGSIVTWSGNGSASYAGDGGPASAARFASPTSIASDGSGGLYVADAGNGIVRRIAVDGTVSCVAGTPLVRSYTGDGGPATLATAGTVKGAWYVCTLCSAVAHGNTPPLRARQASRRTARAVLHSRTRPTSLSGTSHQWGSSVRLRGPASASRAPSEMGAQREWQRATHRVVAANFAAVSPPGACRSAARMNTPCMIAGDSSSILVVDRINHAVRRLYTANLTFAATTVAGIVGSTGSTGNGGPASAAKLNNPSAISSDGAGGWLIVWITRGRKPQGMWRLPASSFTSITFAARRPTL